ncbi:MAG: hypothetical protein ABI888_01840 [Chloroflexota bacterium]
MPAKKKSGARDLIAPHGDKRYVRRDGGKFTSDQVDVGRSRAAEARQAAAGKKAKTTVKPGRGDRGDVRKAK